MMKTATSWTESEASTIQAELSRILSSDLFVRSDRQSRFLRYSVEETLTGGASRLNQFVIGVEVFDRDASFDPAIDSIVRVEAGRLRAKLREYYTSIGSADVVGIELPKGSYAVNFQMDRNASVHGDASNQASEDMSGSSSQNTHTQENPLIAVLPFDNLSGEPEQEYFVDGITEDLITDLSKVPGLGVIARNSTFTYKNKAIKVQQIAQELGAAYVLEGSVRKAGSRIRINAQLVTTKDGKHLWAERYDRELDDIFSVQDDVVKKIVSALSKALSWSTQASIKHKGTDSMEAYDCVLRGAEYFRTYSRENLEQARALFRRAIDLAPTYAEPYSRLAMVYVYEWIAGLTDYSGNILDKALDSALRSVKLDPELARGHSTLGWVYLWQNENDKAIEEGNRAIALDPNQVVALGWMSMAMAWAGRTDEAMQMVERAIRLNPIEPYYFPRGLIYYVMGRFNEAIELLAKSKQHSPDFLPTRLYLASSLALLERDEEGRKQIAELRRISPDFKLAKREKVSSRMSDKEIGNRFVESLQRLGLS